MSSSSTPRLSASAILVTAIDSPVSAASSILSDALSRIRQSAGTQSPASSTIISPTTRSLEATRTSLPSRITLLCAAVISCKAASASSALSSCTTPKNELSSTTNKIIATSAKSPSPLYIPIESEIIAATISIITIGSAICSKKRFTTDSFGASSSLFGPCSLSNCAARCEDSPSLSLECSCVTTSCGVSRYSLTFASRVYSSNH